MTLLKATVVIVNSFWYAICYRIQHVVPPFLCCESRTRKARCLYTKMSGSRQMLLPHFSAHSTWKNGKLPNPLHTSNVLGLGELLVNIMGLLTRCRKWSLLT